MKLRLLWKLLIVNVAAIATVLLIVYLAVDYLAADYFATLMEMYDISPTDTHEMFLDAIHRALAWAALASLCAAVVLSFLLTRRVLKPLVQMTHNTARIAAGDYRSHIEVSSHDEIAQLGRAFNRMAQSLEETQELRRRIVIDVAHELRTPLTNIQGYLEALKDGVMEPSKETLDSLHEETVSLGRLVEDLLELARADAARTTLRCEDMQMRSLVDDVLELYRARFAERAIEVDTTAWVAYDRVHADPEKMTHVLRNLVQNAWQFTPEQGSVSIRAERGASHFKLSVANTGEGVDAADLPYLFERFYRVDASRSRAQGGAGIGLAIVKELVAAHGGEVGALSSTGETVIWFTLPLLSASK